MEKSRVVLYCRVANDSGQMLDSQKERVQAHAANMGFDVVYVITETGSGLVLERPGIKKLFQMAEAHVMDCVLAYDASRYARGALPLMEFTNEMRAKGIEVLSIIDGPLV